MTGRALIVSFVFMALSAAHGFLGLFYPEFPAWKMFKAVLRYEYTLFDAQGRPIDIADWAPKGAYLLNTPLSVFWVGRWLVEHHPELAPLAGGIRVYKREGPSVTNFEIVRTPEGNAQILEHVSSRS
jgi:hypothetical protein